VGGVELRQAANAFQQVAEYGRVEGLLNLVRVYLQEGRHQKAVSVLQKLEQSAETGPFWTKEWLTGVANRKQGRLVEAEQNFRNVLEYQTEDMRRRGFDFSKDVEIINLLGLTLFDQAARQYAIDDAEGAETLMRRAAEVFGAALKVDSENPVAHHNLQRLYAFLGQTDLANRHRELFRRYRPDDHAWGMVASLAHKQYPTASRSAEPVVVYPLTLTAPAVSNR
jgi:tetratricopeptide (TPR) repeat protein